MKIDKHEIGKSTTYFIIEEGQANLGNFEMALKMIDVASQTGADAIEFQLIIASDFYVRNHEGYKYYLEREFSNKQLAELISYTNKRNLDLVVAPFSPKIVEFMAKHGCSAFNINGSDLTNPDIIDAVAECGLPFFLSLLLSEKKEIEWAINRITKKGSSNFSLLLGQHTMASGGHGVSPEHTNMGVIKTLKQRYNVPVGFIDHTSTIWTSACAVAAGADIISKHLALSRADKGPDWQVCLEPDEMKQSVKWVREIKKSINNVEKTLAPGEDIDRSIMRRSIVAAQKIEKGKTIQKENIIFKRPGTGIPPDKFEDIIGKLSKREIFEDEEIRFEDLQ